MAGLGVVWFCGLAYLSAQQVQIWRDTETLWRYALESDPNCAICHGNLGVFFANQGHFELAKAEFERVLALRPDQAKVHQHLGDTHACSETFPRHRAFPDLPRAVPERRRRAQQPGRGFFERQAAEEAIEPLQRAIKVNPGHVLPHVNMGFAYAELVARPRRRACFARRSR